MLPSHSRAPAALVLPLTFTVISVAICASCPSCCPSTDVYCYFRPFRSLHEFQSSLLLLQDLRPLRTASKLPPLSLLPSSSPSQTSPPSPPPPYDFSPPSLSLIMKAPYGVLPGASSLIIHNQQTPQLQLHSLFRFECETNLFNLDPYLSSHLGLSLPPVAGSYCLVLHPVSQSSQVRLDSLTYRSPAKYFYSTIYSSKSLTFYSVDFPLRYLSLSSWFFGLFCP